MRRLTSGTLPVARARLLGVGSRGKPLGSRGKPLVAAEAARLPFRLRLPRPRRGSRVVVAVVADGLALLAQAARIEVTVSILIRGHRAAAVRRLDTHVVGAGDAAMQLDRLAADQRDLAVLADYITGAVGEADWQTFALQGNIIGFDHFG